MAKSDVLDLVDTLSRARADRDICSTYYDDIVYEMALQGTLTAASLVATTADNASYDLPATAVTVLAAVYDTFQLPHTSLKELEAINPTWRSEVGDPIAFVTEDEPVRTVRLYPIPDRTSKDFIFMFGSPLGLDFPEYSLALLHTETRTNLATYFDLPVALEILAREFNRESDHKDSEFAEVCRSLAQSTMQMVS